MMVHGGSKYSKQSYLKCIWEEEPATFDDSYIVSIE